MAIRHLWTTVRMHRETSSAPATQVQTMTPPSSVASVCAARVRQEEVVRTVLSMISDHLSNVHARTRRTMVVVGTTRLADHRCRWVITHLVLLRRRHRGAGQAVGSMSHVGGHRRLVVLLLGLREITQERGRDLEMAVHLMGLRTIGIRGCRGRPLRGCTAGLPTDRILGMIGDICRLRDLVEEYMCDDLCRECVPWFLDPFFVFFLSFLFCELSLQFDYAWP